MCSNSLVAAFSLVVQATPTSMAKEALLSTLL